MKLITNIKRVTNGVIADEASRIVVSDIELDEANDAASEIGCAIVEEAMKILRDESLAVVPVDLDITVQID